MATAPQQPARQSAWAIRAFREGDERQVVPLVKNLLLTYGFSWEPERSDKDVLDPAGYGRDGGTFLVLEISGEILGTIAAQRLDGDRVELRRMYLHPAFWGEGWGSRLLQALLDWARGAGFDRMELETDPRFDRSIGFYERQGFRRVAAHDGDWDSPLRYFRDLAPTASA